MYSWIDVIQKQLDKDKPEDTENTAIDISVTSSIQGQTSSRESKAPGISLEDFDFFEVVKYGIEMLLSHIQGSGKFLAVREKKRGKVYVLRNIMKEEEFDPTGANPGDHLLHLESPFISNPVHVIQSESKLYFIYEYYDGNDLFEFLKKVDYQNDIVKYFSAEIVSALIYLHNQDLIYKHLQSSDILLLDDGHILLTNVGISEIDTYYMNDYSSISLAPV